MIQIVQMAMGLLWKRLGGRGLERREGWGIWRVRVVVISDDQMKHMRRAGRSLV